MGIYDTAVPFAGPLPSWLNEFDAQRLAAYQLYEELYANEATAIKLTLRDDEENPIYIPSARRIIKTLARYVARGLGFTVTGGTPEQQLAIIEAYGDFFNRERFFPAFRAAMRYGLAFGDWCMFLYADPDKPEGSRISVKAVDPGMYFPIFDPKDIDRVVGVRLVEQIIEDNKTLLKQQRWLTARAEGHPSYSDGLFVKDASIVYDTIILELTDWEDPVKRKIVRTEIPQQPLEGIFQLPVYHFKAVEKTGEHFGVSMLQGLERLFYGLNQAVTDEDVAIAMHGLGVYVTNQRPVDAQGNPTDWIVGPRRVVELSGDKPENYFERVPGIAKIEASQDHINFMLTMAESTAGISDVALGQVDTQLAESGIALAIRLGPILDEAGDADELIIATLNQFFFDFKMWLQVYEGITVAPEIEITAVVGPKIPRDIEKDKNVYTDLHLPGVIPTLVLIEMLNELGFDLGDPDELIAAVAEENAEKMKQQQEIFGTTDGDTAGFGGRLVEEGNADDEQQDEGAA
jgi:hypothetical protein